MFDQLVASEPQGADFKNRRRYFMVSSVVVGILFTTAVVVSIFAADFGLGNGNFELVEMIAPVAPEAAEPEVRETRPPAASSSTQSNVPTRQVNMSRTDEPTLVPTSVSTAPNTAMARPRFGDYKIGKFDTESGTPGGTGRDIGTVGPGSTGLGETLAKTDKVEPEETTPPPPAIKKPEPRKTVVSKGVLNGSAQVLPKPNYSAAARQIGAQGQVSVQVTIDETGRVISASAVSGHILLRPEAERAARAARFSPTLLSDVPVKVTGVITYNFVK